MNTDILDGLRKELSDAQNRYQTAKADVERLEWGIGLLEKVCQNGKTQGRTSAKIVNIPTLEPVIKLQDAAREAMKSLGEFTERSLEDQIKKMYPGLAFATKSLRKPMRKAAEDVLIKKIRPNQGNKSQAVWQWVKH